MSTTKVTAVNGRIGLGTDLHELAGGDGIVLAGVCIPCDYSCRAVSDGDVLLHAVVDALLGACGWGDIGELYPAHAVEPGQASSLFVREVLGRVREAGYALVNIDCVVDLEAVRLADWKPAIRTALAALLETEPERVNVKAKTGEGLGPVGEGRAIAAQAVVLLARADGTGVPE